MTRKSTNRTEPGSARILLSVLVTEQDVFTLRRQAKILADTIGLDTRDQVRLATALSELGRDLLRPTAMTAAFTLRHEPPELQVTLAWPDDRVPSEESLSAVTRLLPRTVYDPAEQSTDRLSGRSSLGGRPSLGARPSLGSRSSLGGRITLTHPLRTAVPDPTAVQEALSAGLPATAIDDLQAQTRDLLAALQEAHAQRDELERLNEELSETNAGVMALYAELTVEHKEVVERFAEEHELALALQRTFLPAELPDTPGVELAVRYLPAAATAEIGGDFYEAVHTPNGLLLAVGDVVGHSLQAAMVMGQLRHALRAYAAQGHPPHRLLEHLDHLLQLHQPGWTATVCIVLLESGNRRLHVANAGHLPPLIITPGGPAAYLTEHGPLLGLHLPQPVATAHDITPGTRLLMITDGLVEVRNIDLDNRMRALTAAVLAGPPDPEGLCDALLTEFGKEPDDDIIVFAAHFHALDPVKR
ncbi:PP2C family protein-serine/threonine phosphatase [Streptomyces sp. NPDC058653]|uniref:PP2C family protein-serine/threonine phosphatase n=1 Tax=Streptomyces sp. NPDC058653 TaxID=3346576 RepID=UPI00364EDFB8